MKYPCLVLDHDDTVVKSTVQIHYPAYLHTLAILRPQVTPLSCVGFQEACDTPGLMALYEQTYGFTREEMSFELEDWREFVKEKIPDAYQGIGEVLRSYKQAGGTICVVSHSDERLIRRDYAHHFDLSPDYVYDLTYPKNKPHPDPITDILQQTGFSSEQLLAVDDLPIGLAMAQAAGVDFAYAGWCENAPSIHQKMLSQSPIWFSHPRQLEQVIL